MKYLLQIFAFCFLPFSSIAQDNNIDLLSIIDSLKTEITNHSHEDVEKANLLYEYAWYCLRDQQYIEGFEATLKARAMSTNIGYLDGEIKYLLTLASFTNTFGLGDYNLHRAHLLSQEIYSTLNIRHFAGFWQPGDWDNLAIKLALAIDYFHKKNEIEIEATLIGQIVFCYFYTKEFVTLEKYNDRAIEIHRELKQWFQVLFYHYYKMLNVNNAITNDTEESIEESVQKILEQIGNIDDDPLIPLSLALINAQKKNGSVEAIRYFLEAIEYLRSVNDLYLLSETYASLGNRYGVLAIHDKQIEMIQHRILIYKQLKRVSALQHAYIDLANVLLDINKISEARIFQDSATSVSDLQGEWLVNQALDFDGKYYFKNGNYREALTIYERLYQNAIDQEGYWNRPLFSFHIAECYFQLGDLSSALEYNLKSYKWLQEATNLNLDDRRALLMSKIYESFGATQKAYEYLKIYQELNERKQSDENTNLITQLEVRNVLDKSQREIDNLEQEQLKKEQENRLQRLWILSISGAFLSAIILAFILFRNNKSKQKANIQLKEQKEELQTTLETLESTQSQLIQSEKMASLGELTAGIAHEIQNPLNFVNNFSDVSKELIGEMKEELEKGDIGEAKEIAGDIDSNLEKISHHGKRASGIVKGMLEHSRTGEGKKEPTDINALADEYLRLAYHGLRAKDNSFNADFKTEFDPNLPKINVVPQDIGRVLLNLINNAFFAVNQKARHSEQSEESYDYQPEVKVSTKNHQNSIEISIEDNGPGIPRDIKDKIFQPFFTTKPTGSGTGLGLSLSYDIVKAHGGELKVESKEGVGSEFIINLSIV